MRFSTIAFALTVSSVVLAADPMYKSSADKESVAPVAVKSDYAADKYKTSSYGGDKDKSDDDKTSKYGGKSDYDTSKYGDDKSKTDDDKSKDSYGTPTPTPTPTPMPTSVPADEKYPTQQQPDQSSYSPKQYGSDPQNTTDTGSPTQGSGAPTQDGKYSGGGSVDSTGTGPSNSTDSGTSPSTVDSNTYTHGDGSKTDGSKTGDVGSTIAKLSGSANAMYVSGAALLGSIIAFVLFM